MHESDVTQANTSPRTDLEPQLGTDTDTQTNTVQEGELDNSSYT